MITHSSLGLRVRKVLVWLALTGWLASPVLASDSLSGLIFKSEEVVSRSFPPNLNWLNDGQPGFDPRSFATFAPGQWVEYVLPIPEAGTYRIKARAAGGDSSGVVRLLVDGDPQGDPADLYAATPRSPLDLDWGTVTFLKAGKAIFRLRVEGKNPKSQGCHLEIDSIQLTREDGFALVAPEGACFEEPDPVSAMVGRGAKSSLHRLSRRRAAADDGRHVLRDAQPEPGRTPLGGRGPGCGGPYAALEPLSFHSRSVRVLPGSGFYRQLWAG